MRPSNGPRRAARFFPSVAGRRRVWKIEWRLGRTRVGLGKQAGDEGDRLAVYQRITFTGFFGFLSIMPSWLTPEVPSDPCSLLIKTHSLTAI